MMSQYSLIAMSKPHYNWIDISKGIGIILVIIGHCMFPLHFLIDSFHMPLFFLLAGITYKHIPFEDFIIAKINRIFIPYIFWAIISAVLSLLPRNYSGPFNGPLWFFPAIFTSLIIIYCLSNLPKILQYVFILLFLLVTFSFIKEPTLKVLPFSLDIALLSSVFMYVGVKVQWIKTKINVLSNKLYFLLICLVVFISCYIFLEFNFHPVGAYLTLSIYNHDFLLSLICSFAGIFSTIAISMIINKSKLLEWFGKNSLVLMCVHFPFCQIINSYISTLSIYQYQSWKPILAFLEYFVVFSISIFLTILCKRFLPKMSGYQPLIQKPSIGGG